MDPSQKSIAILCILSFQIWTQTWAMAPVVPRFTYYHRDNPTKALTLEDVKKLPNPPKDLTVFIHGSNAENLEASGIIDFKDNFFEKVPGHDLTMTMDYTPTHIVKYMGGIEGSHAPYWGNQLAGELDKAVGELGIPPSKMDLIPYSLGNAVAAHAGRKFQEMGHGKLNSITGLDPPESLTWSDDNMLKSGDAENVTLIHTSIVGGSKKKRYGDTDVTFIPNSCPSLRGKSKFVRNHRAALEIGMDYLSGQIKDKCTQQPLVSKKGDDVQDPFREAMKKALTPEYQPITVFVLDYSKSMGDDGGAKIKNLIASARSLILSLPLNTQVAMVIFAEKATVVFGPTKITSDEVQASLANQIPGEDKLDSYTSIGAGLKRAIGLIPKGRCANIILVTDGEENRQPYASDVKSNIPECSTVNPIGIGPKAAESLEDLAASTGGRMITIGEHATVQDVHESLQTSEENLRPPYLQTMHYPSKNLDLNSKAEVQYWIDPAIRNLEFNFPSGKSNGAQVVITDPRGDVLKDCKQADLGTSCKSENPAAGEWTVKASASPSNHGGRKKRDLDGEIIAIQVSALPDLDAPSWPVLLEVGLSNSTVQPQDNELIAVYGMLTKEVDLVLGATLEATIIPPEGNTTKLKMYDDGVGADFMKDDGIYSRFIGVPLEKDERYEIFVTASCTKGTCRLFTGADDNNKGAVEVEPFEREAIAGSLRSLQAYKPPPPAPVNDLNVVDYDPSEKVVVLTWTAMGESADSDVKAAGMEMRWAVFNGTGFSAWRKLDENLIYGESMSWVPRELQRARVHFPEEYVTQDEEKHCIYFTLRYHNSGGEFGGESNSVTPCDWAPPDGPSEGNILQIVLILALVVLAMAGATYTCFRYKMYVLLRPKFFSSAGTAEQSEPLLPSGAVL